MRAKTADHFGDGTIVGGWDEMPPVEKVFPHLYPEKTGKKTRK